MPIQFEKTLSVRIFQSVVDQIQKAILSGELAPGDVLPSEMKLKEMFGTSRGTVREALRVLEQKGLVDIKTGVGGGAVVQAVNTKTLTEDLDLLVQCQKVSLDHLAEFREGIEGIVAALAAERAELGDLETLGHLLAEARGILEDENKNWKDFVRIDVRLHIAIAEIAANPVFTAVLRMVHERVMDSSDRFALKERHLLEENYQDLCMIVEAIGQGNPREAGSLARDHVSRFNRHLKADRPVLQSRVRGRE